jgi:3D (Asp-Asp-Asp) domain-containing protein
VSLHQNKTFNICFLIFSGIVFFGYLYERTLESGEGVDLSNLEVTQVEYRIRDRVYAYVTYYCATGEGCDNPICGGNEKTASGSDATKAGGIAVDKRHFPYGTRIIIDEKLYVADDTFGKAMRERDWENGRIHVDIRVAGHRHDEVARMGAGYKWIEILKD